MAAAGVMIRRAVTAAVGFGPALLCLGWIALRYGPTELGWPAALALGAAPALGLLGLSALALAWLPRALELAGLERAAAALRRVWDEDAR
jgi:hypothetical protein